MSGALVAVVLGAALLLLRAAGSGPSTTVIATLVVTVAAAGLAVGAIGAVRRLSTRALAAAAGTGALALAALLGLGTALLVLGRLPDSDEWALIGPAAAGVLLCGLVAGPLTRSAAALARTWAQGTERAPAELLDSFADRAAAGAPLPELLRELGESVRRAWRLSVVEIWTGGGDQLVRELSIPDHPGRPVLGIEALRVLRRVGVAGPGWLRLWLPDLLDGRGDGQLRIAPGVHGTTVLALVVVERPADADRLDSGDERALVELARRLAIVLRNRDLDDQLQDTLLDLRSSNAELRASRARLVAVADDERRRIGRDLHDGAQQHLVSLTVGLGRLREAGPAHGAPADWERTLDGLDELVRSTLGDLRDLAQGIYPALLRDAGISAALRSAARRSPNPVEVDLLAVGRHSPGVEAAVYFCCVEALQNAAKHAPCAAVQIEVRREGSILRFEVRDEGPGFEPASTPTGSGLQNMADRIGAVGGALTYESAPGAGTIIRGSLPVEVVV
ncbi:MAG: sensor histidine kinase [Pseudonocardiales bacterium]